MVDLTGPLGAPIAALKTMLSNSAAWQEWTGENSAEGALGHVYVVGSLSYTPGITYPTGDLQDRRPLAIINFAPTNGFHMEIAGDGAFVDNGRLTIFVEDNIPDGTTQANYQDIVNTFINNLGAVLSDLRGASSDGGSLIITRIVSGTSINRVKPEQIRSYGDHHFVPVIVEYGPK